MPMDTKTKPKKNLKKTKNNKIKINLKTPIIVGVFKLKIIYNKIYILSFTKPLASISISSVFLNFF